MELINTTIPMDCTIFNFGDLHYGALNCNREAIRTMIADLESKPTNRAFNVGDNLDGILPNDKRYLACATSVKEGILTPQDQADSIIKDFRPVRRKILAWGMGNHEYKLASCADFTRYIAGFLDCPNGGYSYKLVCQDDIGNTLFRIFATHGNTSIPSSAPDLESLEGRQKAALRRKLGMLRMSDCIYQTMGHTHKLVVSEPTVRREINMIDDGTDLVRNTGLTIDQSAEFIPDNFRWYANSGSFLNTFTPSGSGGISYSEVAMFGPVNIGYLKLHVQGGQLVEVERVILS